MRIPRSTLGRSAMRSAGGSVSSSSAMVSPRRPSRSFRSPPRSAGSRERGSSTGWGRESGATGDRLGQPLELRLSRSRERSELETLAALSRDEETVREDAVEVWMGIECAPNRWRNVTAPRLAPAKTQLPAVPQTSIDQTSWGRP